MAALGFNGSEAEEALQQIKDGGLFLTSDGRNNTAEILGRKNQKSGFFKRLASMFTLHHH